MGRRATPAFIVTTVGSLLLFAAAALHIVGGVGVGFPALASSNLDPGLQTAFRVVFLAVAWHWILLGAIALVAAFRATALRRVIVLVCGAGVLIEAVLGATQVGLFLGNELIGAAAVLMTIGGLLFE